jgi:hypothetical protein
LVCENIILRSSGGGFHGLRDEQLPTNCLPTDEADAPVPNNRLRSGEPLRDHKLLGLVTVQRGRF